MAYFNVVNFRRETQKARNSFKNIAKNAALAKFNSIKLASIEEFENNVITREIEGWPTADNLSNTLGGRGNLFSFIGFNKEEKPINVVREALESIWQLQPDPVIEEKDGIVSFKFKVRTTNLQYLYSLTPLPWEEGKSWLQGIEKGISGLGRYIYWRTYEDNRSRSSTGVQADNVLRSANFTPRPYLSKIIGNFRKRFDQ